MLTLPKRLLSRLRRERRGFAVVETALMMPIFMMLLMGGLEIAMLVLAHHKVGQVAASLADLTAQSEAGALESQITDLLLSARFVAEPHDIQTEGRVFVAAVRGGGSGVGNTILWQRCSGALAQPSAIATADNRNVPLPNAIAVEEDAIVIVGEAALRYEPMLFTAFVPTQTIRRVVVNRPRARDFTTITPDGTAALSACGSNVTQY